MKSDSSTTQSPRGSRPQRWGAKESSQSGSALGFLPEVLEEEDEADGKLSDPVDDSPGSPRRATRTKDKKRSMKTVAQRLMLDVGGTKFSQTQTAMTTSHRFSATTTGAPNGALGVSPRLQEEVFVSYLRFTPALYHEQLGERMERMAERSTDEDIYGASCKTYTMALLFLDISGFTKMSVKLGAELTRKHTSQFFGQIIDRIVRYGGDVLKFLGDAMLVCWTASLVASTEEKQHIAASAVQCAASVMKRLNGYQIADDIVLTLHGGIAIGHVHAFDVGGAERREFLIGGSVLAELGDMEAEALSGELVMSSEFADLLRNRIEVVETSQGNKKLAAVYAPSVLDSEEPLSQSVGRWFGQPSNKEHEQKPIPRHIAMQAGKLDEESDDYEECLHVAEMNLDSLKAHVPHGCHMFIDESKLDNLGDMRSVTTLFMSLDALTPYLNSADADTVQQAFLVIVEAVHNTGGILRQFVLDDKGCVAICAWGLPCAAHGEVSDAVRALRCAFQMIEGYRHLDTSSEGFPISPGPKIGIAAGEAYVGLIGSQMRCEYAMVGPSVNLSARLMGKADQWKVLVEEQVHNRVVNQADSNLLDAEQQLVASSSAFSFQPVSPIKAKGYDNLIPVYEPKELLKSETHSSFEHVPGNQLDDFIEKWDRLGIEAQLVGKVAAVLADGPNGNPTDFPFQALVDIVAALNITSQEQARSAIVQMKTNRLLRLTRGARRGKPSYAFTLDWVQAWVLAVITKEYASKVHGKYYKWLQAMIDVAEGDLKEIREQRQPEENETAKLILLHQDVDWRLEYHQQMAKERGQPLTTTQWFVNVMTGTTTTVESSSARPWLVRFRSKVESLCSCTAREKET